MHLVQFRFCLEQPLMHALESRAGSPTSINEDSKDEYMSSIILQYNQANNLLFYTNGLYYYIINIITS